MNVPANLAPTAPARLPVAADHNLRVYVARLDPPMQAGVSAYEIAERDAPSDGQRAALAVRRDLLDGWLRPAGEAVATKFYAIFQASMAVPERAPQEAVLHLRSWVADAATVPEFALDKACAAVRQGIIGDGKWMPEVGVVVAEARRHVAIYAKERREIEAVLNAKVIAGVKSRKTELLAIAASLVKTMPLAGAKAEAERRGRVFEEAALERPDEPRRGEDLDQFRARMLREAAEAGRRPMPKLGDALRKSIGLPPEPGPDWRDDEHAA